MRTVGDIIAMRSSWKAASASAGRTQSWCTASPSSCAATSPSGSAARKKRVSKRRGGPSGVIQWATWWSSSARSRRPSRSTTSPNATLAPVERVPLRGQPRPSGPRRPPARRPVAGRRTGRRPPRSTRGWRPPSRRVHRRRPARGAGRRSRRRGLAAAGGVLGVDRAARVDPHRGGEDLAGAAPQHQHVQVGAVVHQHHGGRRPDRDRLGVVVERVDPAHRSATTHQSRPIVTPKRPPPSGMSVVSPLDAGRLRRLVGHRRARVGDRLGCLPTQEPSAGAGVAGTGARRRGAQGVRRCPSPCPAS